MPSRPPALYSRPRRSDNWSKASAEERGYGRLHRAIRKQVLAEEPICRMCDAEGFVIALLDVAGTLVRLQVQNGGAVLVDQTVQVVDCTAIFAVPIAAGNAISISIRGIGPISAGSLIVGSAIDLGEIEDGPTVGIDDFSKRTTDDFGVTTIVERNWSKTITSRLALAGENVDAVQQELAAIRARPVLWIGHPDFGVLTAIGYYKDFSIDLQLQGISLCSLTIEGLPSVDAPLIDLDPAPEGDSSLMMIRPVEVTDDVLKSSSVPENDAPAWDAGTTYAIGAHVIVAAAHRIFESAVAGNLGHDPAQDDGANWIDIGPTNRWAMFDQAIGSLTTAADQISVELATFDAITALALLDVQADSVRVQSAGYDRTLPVSSGSVSFLDLPQAVDQLITVTAIGPAVAIGTLVFGVLSALGVTGDVPTVGILDYSKKDTDDFGKTTVVERAWAKRMAVTSLISTDAADNVMRRMAAVRAKPTLWVAMDGIDALTIYGFFRDFSIQIGENVSTYSATIEGLSAAAKVVPLAGGGAVDWSDITGAGKPTNNATNTADPNAPFGGGTVADAISGLGTVTDQIRAIQESTVFDGSAPNRPTGLTSDGGVLQADGTISLTFGWTANTEGDLAGYVLSVALDGGRRGSVQRTNQYLHLPRIAAGDAICRAGCGDR